MKLAHRGSLHLALGQCAALQCTQRASGLLGFAALFTFHSGKLQAGRQAGKMEFSRTG